MSVMNFGRIRDLVSNLGWLENENTYSLGVDSLSKELVSNRFFFLDY